MDEELEGISLEGAGSVTDKGIILPSVEEVVEDTSTDETSQVEDTTKTIQDEGKDNLQKSLNYERNKRKAAEKENKKLEARIAKLEEASKANEKSTYEELIATGMDENIAKTIAQSIDKKTQASSDIEKKLADVTFRNELLEKSKDSEFDDILDYEDEIKTLVDKGLTIEQSYYALNHENHKTHNTNSEIERKVEAKMQNNQTRKQILGNINSNAGGAVDTTKQKSKATAAEIATARMAGIDIDDYIAARDANSFKQYDEYSKKKMKK